MPLARSYSLVLAILVPVIVAVAIAEVPAADKWLPIDQAELANRTPKVEPNADAEGLLWDVRVSGESGQGLTRVATIFEHYLRIKIFTDRGRDTQSQVALRYRDDAINRSRIQEIEARTIAPDGTITELQARDIFDRSVIEQNGIKMKTKSFALPAVVPGAIVEYRWKEVREDGVANYLPLSFQRDIPIQVVRYHIRPLALPGLEPRSQTFNVDAKAVQVSNEKDGFTALEVRNMRALKREPYMPPERSVEAWTLLFYRSRTAGEPTEAEFWSRFGKTTYERLRPHIRVTDEIKKLAVDTTRGLGTPPEKPQEMPLEIIDALVKVARQRVKRIDVDTVPAAERSAWKPNRDAGEVLRRGIGTGDDLTGLFIAMAAAAGLEASLAVAPDRTVSLGQPVLRQPNFMRHILAAVKLGTAWRFVDPANEHASGGHTRWQQEGTQALLLDPDAPTFVVVPLSTPQRSLRRRTGTLKLTDSGSLEGDMRFEYTGHWAVQFRERDDGESPAEIETFFRNELGRQIPGSVVSDVAVEHLTDPEQPYVVRLKVSVPGYAQLTGSRLFVQPAVMVRGIQSVFSASERQQSIHFPFAYSEEDTMTIELPQGYELEPGAPPQAFGIDNGATARYAPAVKISTDNRQLSYTRALTFGSNNRIFYQRNDYPGIKAFFDSIHTADNYTVALRRGAPAGDSR